MNMKELVAGIDVGGTNTRIGLVDKEGCVRRIASFRTTDYPVFCDYMSRIFEETEKLVVAEGCRMAGIGIGAANGNYFTGYMEDPINISWYEQSANGSVGKRMRLIPFVEQVKRYYPEVTVLIDNDANVAALGEMMFGGAKRMRDFVAITLGTGLGAGVVANGELVRGYGGTAGELGHIIVTPGGRECGCGRRGCLETYVSATGIKRTVEEMLADGAIGSSLKVLASDELDGIAITKAAQIGDKLALEAFEYTGEVLGLALANIATVTFPEAIFLLGGLSGAGEYIFNPTRKYMEQNLLRNYIGKVRLLPTGVDNANAAILGAAALIWQKL